MGQPGISGVTFLYQVLSIGVDIYGTAHTNFLALRKSADALFDKITDVGNEVVAGVVGFGIGRIAEKLSDVFRRAPTHGTCSFDGDTLVLARDGYTPIRDIEAGLDQVWGKSELTGEAGWKGVLAQYSNTYEETVHTRVRDKGGNEHTLTSNRIHPFFARVAAGVLLTVAAEGHVYAGDIEDGAWVDAQHLQVGDELLGSDSEWQEVVGTEIQVAELQAHNLTVDGYSTYFVAGDKSAAGVWVHNACFEANDFPDDFDDNPIDERTFYGQDQFIGPNDEIIYRGHDGRFYTLDHPPSPNLAAVASLNVSDNAARGRLGTALGATPNDGFINHHVIPWNAKNLHRDLLIKAAQGGFNINGRNNGRLVLPADHRGNHPNYSAQVMADLAQIDVNLTPGEIAEKVQAVADKYKDLIDRRVLLPDR